MKSFLEGFLLVVLCLLGNPVVAGSFVRTELVAEGLALPVAVRNAGDGSNRLFIVELAGRIRILDDGVLRSVPFLDISDRVAARGEGGLLGLAFHPAYKQNGRFFVYYTASEEGQFQTVVSEFHVSEEDPDRASEEERRLLGFDQPDDIHNAGDLQFGPNDGLLYIATGDGGPLNPEDHAQDPSLLLGKILRIDVDSPTLPYGVPPDNPFVDREGYRPEIWATGMRNPFRMSFDSVTGRLFAGDVGAAFFEEVDIIEKGRNYGWPVREGFHCFPGSVQSCPGEAFTDPIFEYGRVDGSAVTGGYVYRGNQQTPLYGSYIFGDFVLGRIWALEEVHRGRWVRRQLADTDALLVSFGEDEDGELYGVSYVAGRVFRLYFEWEEILPQAVDGDLPDGRITSLLALNNTNDSEVQATLEFFDAEGQPGNVIVGGEPGSSFQVAIGANSGLTVPFGRNATDLFEGWVRVRSERPVSSSLLYSLFTPDGRLRQARVLNEGSSYEFTAAVGNNALAGLGNAFAIVNPGDRTIEIEMEFEDSAGSVRRGLPIRVEPFSQVSFFLTDVVTLPGPVLGTVRVFSAGQFVVSSLVTINGFPSASLPLSAGAGRNRVP